jgi:hypothetical protein
VRRWMSETDKFEVYAVFEYLRVVYLIVSAAARLGYVLLTTSALAVSPFVCVPPGITLQNVSLSESF